jgi:hypothetical protein
MSAKFFILYSKTGKSSVTPHLADEVEVIRMATMNDPEFKPGLYETMAARIAEAGNILQGAYSSWALFEGTPEGMAEFLEVAAQGDSLAAIHALEVAHEYVEDAQKALAVAFTEAQQKAMERVQFPIAGDKQGFTKYQERISSIRDLSIKALYEYVENGDEFPE